MEHSQGPWPHFANMSLGLWLITSAFALGYRSSARPVYPAPGSEPDRRGTDRIETLDGMDARADTAGGTVFLGNRLLMDTQQPRARSPWRAEATPLQADGRTVVHVSQAARVIDLIAIADAIRPTSKAAVAKLRERKIDVVMLDR